MNQATRRTERIRLPNGCYCSQPKVSPKDCNTTARKWCIQYRFYDPTVINGDGKVVPQLVIVKGMNEYQDLAERRRVCRDLITNEIKQLLEFGFNPITGTFALQPGAEPEAFFELDPATPFIKAMWAGLEKVACVHETKLDMECALRGVESAAIKLRFENIPVRQITRKYIRAILDHCGKVQRTKKLKNGKTFEYKWTAARHNKYRAYLRTIFSVLVEMEAIDSNPIHDIAIMTETKGPRQTLTAIERSTVDYDLRTNHYNFWRLLQVFFHSGSRKTELCKVKGKDINLAKQECHYKVMKGPVIRIVPRPIKDIALPFWEELMASCGPEDYLFTTELIPGSGSPLKPNYISKLWHRLIKVPFGINADFYCLKHMNTSETIDALIEIKKAAQEMIKQTGHTTPVVLIKSYDTKSQNRENDALKKVRNNFAG